MVKAQALLPDPFFCVNSDNVWLDGPRNALLELSDRWDPAIMDALLLVVPHPRAHHHTGPGDFHLDAAGRITRRKPGRVAPYIYIGIQIVSHRLLRDAPEGSFSTNVLWQRAIEEGHTGWSIPVNGSRPNARGRGADRGTARRWLSPPARRSIRSPRTAALPMRWWRA